MAERGFIRVEWEGLPDLIKALNDLPTKTVRRSVINEASKDAMRPMLLAAKINAPRDTGKLRRGIVLRVMKAKEIRNRRAAGGAKITFRNRQWFGIPDNAKGFYPVSQEFGWKTRGSIVHEGRSFQVHVPGSRYLRRSFDRHNRGSERIFNRTIWTAIEKRWAKIAKKKG